MVYHVRQVYGPAVGMFFQEIEDLDGFSNAFGLGVADSIDKSLASCKNANV